MNTNHTITISGNRLPTHSPVRILTSNDRRAGFVSEITGPTKAFRIIEGTPYDKVKVVKPDLVSIKTMTVL